ncbi:MAG: galactokinase [Acidobacteria bacterium]|nr:galactokinase [Acidobacteriota bacterium]MCA1641104.1 galactokinase [Acidobacteriota bacterium]
MIDADALRETFRSRYGREARLFRAPGRVNLIGEHTDYNDGFVLPMAIDRETVAAAAPRADRRVRVCALDLGEEAEFDLDRPGAPRRGRWLDYVEGVAQSLAGRGVRLGGADLAVTSSVPPGSGLSSSAALEISVGLALATVSDKEVPRVELALAGQEAEHVWVGAMVGIMDQFVSALAERGHALLIDCRSLAYSLVPLDTSETAVVVCDTNVRHELASSEYNARRAECERGVEILRGVLPKIAALRDVSVGELERYETLLPEPVRRRCRHVVNENERTLAAAAALRRRDLWEVGRLMDRSHRSLRDDYEVSCHELDVLVEIAGNFGGAMGARMTGGGFGGSTVNLVRRDAVDEFRETVSSEYNRATGRRASVLVSEPGDGAGEILD